MNLHNFETFNGTYINYSPAKLKHIFEITKYPVLNIVNQAFNKDNSKYILNH